MALDDKKFMEMLIDKKVADAYQYYESSSYKLYLAKITISALENIVNDLIQFIDNEQYDDVFSYYKSINSTVYLTAFMI